MTETNPSSSATTVSPQTQAYKREVVITRIFDSPRDLVFKMWTDPKHLAQWWGPRWFTTPVCEVDVRPGGSFLIHMQGPDGAIYPMKGIYQEVVEPERLAYTNLIFDDEEGNPRVEVLTTVTFADLEGHPGKTKLTMLEQVIRATTDPDVDAGLGGMEEGMSQSLDKLAAKLVEVAGQPTTNRKTQLIVEPGKQEVVITRDFDAPRALVFKAHTDPDAISQWWGPAYLKTTIEKMDVKPGGVWRFVQTAPDGTEFGFHGVYHDVVSPERIVQTFEFEGVPGHVVLETTLFEERDGKTTLVMQSVFQSVDDRDAMIQSGMESGLDEGMNRLDNLLRRLAQD